MLSDWRKKLEEKSYGATESATTVLEQSGSAAGEHIQGVAKEATEVVGAVGKHVKHGMKVFLEDSWRRRGTVNGILLDLAGSFGSNAMLVILMFWHMDHKDRAVLPCTVGGKYNLDMPGALMCEYTKAYIRCFPSLAMAMLVLIESSHLLQKRLYYCLLEGRGVLHYRMQSSFQDPCMWLLLWGYAHIVFHLSWLCYMSGWHQASIIAEKAYKDYADKKVDTGWSHKAQDQIALEESIMDLITFVILPSSIFLVFFNQTYDIVAGLVPLSEVVDGGESVEVEAQFLSSLAVVDDSTLKAMVDDTGAHGCAVKECTEFEDVVKLYRTGCKDISPSARKVILFDSLWAAQLLQRPSGLFDGVQEFYLLWLGNFAGAAVLLVLALLFLAKRVYIDEMDVVAKHYEEIPAVVVEFAHAIVILFIFYKVCLANFHMVMGCQHLSGSSSKPKL